MPKQKETNFNLILIVIVLIIIAWLFYTGIIWYIVGLAVVIVVGYIGIKIYNATQTNDKQVTAPPTPTPSTPEPTIIKEKEIIKEIVMIQCEYCRTLMPQTATSCPVCGAKRTR